MRKFKWLFSLSLFLLLLTNIVFAEGYWKYLDEGKSESETLYLYIDNTKNKQIEWVTWGGSICALYKIKDNTYIYYNAGGKELLRNQGITTSDKLEGCIVNNEGYWVCEHGSLFHTVSSNYYETDDGCTYGSNTNLTDSSNPSSDSLSSDSGNINPYERNLSSSELDIIGELSGNKIEIATPFCSLFPQLGEASDIVNNFNLYGIYLAGNINQYSGNIAFLENTDDGNDVNTFKNLLEITKYNFTNYANFIEKVKNILKITGTKLKKAESFISNKAANDAMKARTAFVKENIIQDILEAICKTIGIFLILYSIVIIIGGAVDETGIIEKSMMGILTGNGINKDKPLGMMSKNNHIQNAFRMSYLWVGGWCLLVGIFMWSTSLRNAAMFLLSEKIMKPIFGIFGKPTIKTWK